MQIVQTTKGLGDTYAFSFLILCSLLQSESILYIFRPLKKQNQFTSV